MSTITVSDEEWADYKAKFKKTYDDSEDKERRTRYLESKKTVEEHNAKYEKGEVSFSMGINQFSDKKSEEVCCHGRKTARPKPPTEF